MFRLSAIALFDFFASTFGPSQVGNAVRVTAIEKELSLRFLSLMQGVHCPRSTCDLPYIRKLKQKRRGDGNENVI